MGLVYNNLRVLLSARRQGTSFARTLTIGRQQLYLAPREVRWLAQEFPEFDLATRGVPPPGAYCEEWLCAWLGCQSVTAIDASDYEGAQLVHDMNQPIPPEWELQFSAVIDGGSLEHIYFATTAIANAMRLTSIGGWLFIASVANNHCGHGFYQFSPEWFFRTLSAENGFQLQDVLLMPHRYPGVELSSNRRLYRVSDPCVVGGRVGLVGRHPAMIFASAQRTVACELFRQPPQQSDYQHHWAADGPAAVATASAVRTAAAERPRELRSPRLRMRRWLGTARRALIHRLPSAWMRRWQGYSQRRAYALSNRRAFEVWHPPPAPPGERVR